jgi:hypothetical protein
VQVLNTQILKDLGDVNEAVKEKTLDLRRERINLIKAKVNKERLSLKRSESFKEHIRVTQTPIRSPYSPRSLLSLYQRFSGYNM